MTEELWLMADFSDRLTVLRPTWVYGPGDRRNTFRLVRLVQRLLILTLPPQALHPVYIDDLVKLMLAIIVNLQGQGQTWLISGCEITSYKQIAEIIADCLQKRILCLRVSAAWLSYGKYLMNWTGQSELAQRLENWQIDKTWHDPDVWRHLTRAPVSLSEGLFNSIRDYISPGSK